MLFQDNLKQLLEIQIKDIQVTNNKIQHNFLIF